MGHSKEHSNPLIIFNNTCKQCTNTSMITTQQQTTLNILHMQEMCATTSSVIGLTHYQIHAYMVCNNKHMELCYIVGIKSAGRAVITIIVANWPPQCNYVCYVQWLCVTFNSIQQVAIMCMSLVSHCMQLTYAKWQLASLLSDNQHNLKK